MSSEKKRDWLDDWGIWLFSVLAVMGFGVLIGYDLTSLEGAASGVTAIGTLMLGTASLIAVKEWRRQEQHRFQAQVAAKLYAKFSPVRLAANSSCNTYLRILSIHESKVPRRRKSKLLENLARNKIAVQDDLEELLIVIKNELVPQAALLSESFFDDVGTLEVRIESLLNKNSWLDVENRHFRDILTAMDDLNQALCQLALFKS